MSTALNKVFYASSSDGSAIIQFQPGIATMKPIRRFTIEEAAAVINDQHQRILKLERLAKVLGGFAEYGGAVA
jgi:hypothetical protein